MGQLAELLYGIDLRKHIDTGMPRREKQKALDKQGLDKKETGRGERIRTSDSYVPNVVLYQAELHPDLLFTR